MTSVVRVLPLVGLLLSCPLSAQGQQPSANSSQKPLCPIAQDDTYAYTTEQPVQVGGSPTYGAARQRRYLDALRGPEGQPVQYKRSGQVHAPDGTILDLYIVSHGGLEKPVSLYLDWYHFNTPRAPQGFTCGAAFNLNVPPPSFFQEMDDARKVAMTLGVSKELAPIPLKADDPTPHGVIYDRFRMMALAAREAKAKNPAFDPANAPMEMMQQPMVVVAYPLTCGTRTVQPMDIDLIAADGTVMPKDDRRRTIKDGIAQQLHGAQVPAGSLAFVVQNGSPRPNDSVKITYAETACGADGPQVSLPMVFTPGRPIEMPQPALPAGTTADEPVLVQILIDLDGAGQQPTYVGGPQALFRAAADAVGRWRFEPPRVNGAPMTTGVLLQVRFTPRPQ
jgi:hypothetical protein